jgi:hypothetical protein
MTQHFNAKQVLGEISYSGIYNDYFGAEYQCQQEEEEEKEEEEGKYLFHAVAPISSTP